MPSILIGLGSNIEPEVHVPAAVRGLRAEFGAVRLSTFYWTRPLRGRQQAAYVNGVVCAETAATAPEVKAVLAKLEQAAGRVRVVGDAYASRTLDLDLLWHGELSAPEIGVPAPDLLTRDFVLVPAAEVLPEGRHPVVGRTLRELAAERFPNGPDVRGVFPFPINEGSEPDGVRDRLTTRGMICVLLLVAGCLGSQFASVADGGAAAGVQHAALLAAVGPGGRAGAVLASLRRIGAVVAAVYLGLCAYMYLAQSRYVFFPSRDLALSPGDLDLEFEDVRLRTGDGGEVHGWWIPAALEERGVVLVCHGNAGNISHRMDTILTFRELGFSVFIFDYRGYGQSPGKPTETGTYADVEAAWGYLTRTRGVEPGRVLLFGRSLGGPVAAWLARKEPAGALVVESSFFSVAEIGRDVYPFLPVRLLCRLSFSTGEYVRQARCPVIVVHSPDDELVRYRHGEAIYDAATEPKHFVRIEGSHNQGFLSSGRLYTEALDHALSTYFPALAGEARGDQSRGGDE